MDAEPVDVPAVAAGVDDVEPPNPVHDVLITCGITNLAHRMTFLNIEGLDSIAAFASMSGDPDVTEMAKRQQCVDRPVGCVRDHGTWFPEWPQLRSRRI
jgi:hypothetical protein